MIKIWKNTATLDGFDEGLFFTDNKKEASIALLGSKPITLSEFPLLKGIFRAGIGKDNVPENEAKQKGIIVRYPSKQTSNIIFNETASFTCNLIFKMLYQKVGDIETWAKEPREAMHEKNLLVVGMGNIGRRVFDRMKYFMKVDSFDVLENDISELNPLLCVADCITLHIPNVDENKAFFDKKKLSKMKNNSVLVNTARGPLVDESALYQEIRNKRIRAAFDVFWKEPYDGKLKEFYPENFFMTPHISSTCNAFVRGCRDGLNELIGEI